MDVIYLVLNSIYENFIDNPINTLVGIATILGIPGIIIVYIKQRKDIEKRQLKAIKDDQASIAKNIYLELRYTWEIITVNRYPDNCGEVYIEIDGVRKKVYYANVELNYDFYDSLADSGTLRFLEALLQQNIQSAYRLVKKHNRYLNIINEKLVFDFDNEINTNNQRKQASQYLNWINGAEDTLMHDIPIILKELKKQF